MDNKIEVGQIWQVVTNNFWSSKVDNNKINGRKISYNFKRDEYIEIRYPSEWHFRTIDNIYAHAYPTEILKHCRYIGKINENTRFENKKKLQEILDENLYSPIWGEL